MKADSRPAEEPKASLFPGKCGECANAVSWSKGEDKGYEVDCTVKNGDWGNPECGEFYPWRGQYV
jgi:hypothetical protein